MKNLYRSLLTGWLLLFSGFFAFAQLPPNQPEQDCFNSIPVCQNIYNQPNSYQGAGNDPNEIDPANSCLGTGERNSAWYIFTVSTPGNVCFSVTPLVGTNDYDWAVYNLTNANCSDIATDPTLEVSCNYAPNVGCGGVTGPNGQNTGPCGVQNEACLSVQVGETYVVNVSNFSSNANGYTLDFSNSTATIFDNISPEIDTLIGGCGAASVTVVFSENILCSSIDVNDFTITGPGGPYAVTGLNSGLCQTGGAFENTFVLQTSPAITALGNFTVTLAGQVEDNCGNLSISASEDIFIGSTNLTAEASPSTICLGQSVQLSSNFANTPGYGFSWEPGNLRGASPTVTPTTTTTYTLTATDPAGCVSTDDVTVTVLPSPSSTFTLASQACVNQAVNLTYTGNAGSNASFLWDFDGGNPIGGGGLFQVSWSTSGTKTVTLSVVENGCISPVTTQTIDVFSIPQSTFLGPNAVCQADTAVYTYTGDAAPSSTFFWSFAGATYIENTNPNSDIGPYKVVWANAGTRNVCLQVDNNGCASTTRCIQVTVQPEPEARIAGVSNQCFPGNSFQFVSSGDADVENWFWNFGADALPAQSQSETPPAVSYQTPGVKRVTLVVQRNGCLSDTALINFEVVPEPSADFTVSSQTTCQDGCLDFAYSGISLGPNQTYQWDFGAGAVPSTTSLPSLSCVRYGSAGTKDVSLTVNFRGCVVSTTQQVEVYPNPSADAGALVEFCEGSGGVQINATIDGGVQPYFYEWTCEAAPDCGLSDPYTEDPIANPDLVLATDTILYYLEATDFNGCSSGRDSVRVVVKAQPKLDAGPDVTICEEGPGGFLEAKPSRDNTAPLPFQYFWTPVEGLGNNTGPRVFARPDTTTIYTVQAIAANGCASEVTTLDTLSTVTVRVNPLPIAEAGADTALCEGESIMLQGSASEAGPQYSYSWTPATAGTIVGANTATPTITPAFTTEYTLVVTSNGCASRGDTVVVIVDTRPTTTAGPDRTVCQGDTLRLFGGASGDPGANFYTYEWSPAIGFVDEATLAQPRLVSDTTRRYVLQASSNFGCGSDADTVLVTVKPTPIVEALQADTVICQGDTLPLSAVHSFTTPGGRPVTYRWLPAGSVVGSPALPDVRVLPQVTTRYVVEASVAGDCPTTDAVLVTVSPKVEAGIEADTTRLCAGTSVLLEALGSRGNASFTWLPAAGLSDPGVERLLATPDTTTTYQVLVTEGVCADTASITLEVNPTPVADYFSSQPAGCEGLEVHFIATSPSATSYVWNFGDGSALSNAPTPSHVYNEAGEYPVSLTVVGAGGCESTATLTTVRISASSAAAFTASPGPGDELNLPAAAVQFTDQSQAAVRWYWDFGDGATATLPNPGHVYGEAGSYTVSLTVTDENGCVSTATEGPFTVAADNLLIPNVFTPNGDGTNDVYTVRYNGTDVFSLQVYDRWGRNFFESDAAQDGWDGLDPEGQPAKEGVYFYLVRIGEQEYNGNVTLLR